MLYEDLIVKNNTTVEYCVDIKYKARKREHKMLKNTIFALCFVFLLCFNVLFIFDTIDTPFTNRVLYTIQSMFIDKPTNELFEDGSRVFFVNWLLNINQTTKTEKLPDIELAKNITGYELEYKTLIYEVNDSIVYCNAGGIVKSIASDDNGNKQIVISHGGGYLSIYENIDCVGVIAGEMVEMGQILALTASDNFVCYYLMKNDEIVELNIDEVGNVLY